MGKYGSEDNMDERIVQVPLAVESHMNAEVV